MVLASLRAVAAWPLVALLALSLPALPVHADPAAAPAADPVHAWTAAEAGPAGPLIELAGTPDLEHLDRAVDSFLSRPLGPTYARDVVPPESIYRAIDPVCDLDGNGSPDVVTNDMQVRKAGQFDAGSSRIRALSGTDGEQLWSKDNLRYSTLTLAHGLSSARPGQPKPESPPNVIPTVDVNKDGVCDILAYGYENSPESIQAPLFGEPAVLFVDVTVRMLDGRNGTTLWSQTVRATIVDVSEPIFSTTANQAILGFPTGFGYYETADGPRFILKTTDVRYNYAHDIVGLGGVVFHTDRDGFYVVNAQTVEHLFEGDASTGAILWQRDFGTGGVAPVLPDPAPRAPPLDVEADRTNITWISGLANLDGDGQPDVVLDQFTLSNPRGSAARNPQELGGGDLYKNGRGMRMMAVSGADGAPLWSTTILDPLAVQTRPVNEENLEILAWTYGTVLAGRDGSPDLPVAQYLTEDMVGGTPNGRHRTHFLPLTPATGTPLWDHVQQGWGFLSRLGDGPHGAVLAAATLDLPQPTDAGAAYPAKSTRYSGLDAETGQPLWATETPFAQDSQSAYEIGLHQVHSTLAPLDIDGDGLLDPVSVSQYVPPAGKDQVFLATAEQRFDVLSGASGKVLRTMTLWGSNGLLLPCGDPHSLTFAVGHARRIDLQRMSLDNGSLAWRRAIWDFQEPRSSTEGIDLMAMDGVCSTLADGSLAYGVNMEAYSFARQYEILPLFGVLDGNGTAVWRSPEILHEPPTPSLLETLHQHDTILLPPGTQTWLATAGALAVGALVGWALAGPIGRALGRRRRRLDPLGIALILMMVPAGMLPGHAGDGHAVADVATPPDPAGDVAAPAQPAWAAAASQAAAAALGPSGNAFLPGGSPLATFAAVLRGTPDAATLVRAITAYHAAMGTTPDVSDSFDENSTLSYPLVIGDQDGDGVDDVALDLYCVDGTSCYDAYPGLLNDPVASAQDELRTYTCGPHHKLIVLSGARGDRLWDAPLDRPHPLSMSATETCGAEAVVGTVPLPDNGTGILIERYEATDTFEGFTGRVLNTTLYLMDAGTGSVRWRFSEPGYVSPTYFAGLVRQQVSRSVLLNPILTHGESSHVPDRTSGSGVSLLVQGIGYELADINTLVPPPGFTDSPRAVDSYEPMEWLARLDPVTGQVMWRVDSFMPQTDKSVLPIASLPAYFHQPDDFQGAKSYDPYGYPYTIPLGVPPNHWANVACCGDLNGDHVSDPVFTTLEWGRTPNANTGAYRFDAEIVAFDGASGARIFGTKVVTGLPGEEQRTPYSGFPADSFGLTLQAIGDADGDGKGDILVHLESKLSDPHWTLAVRSGVDGHELWAQDFPRAQYVQPLGDTDGDHGNDLLFFQWFDLERLMDHTRGFDGPFANVTDTPLFLRSGATGKVLREDHTISAPVDLEYIYTNAAFNGLPDVDHDGVADYPTDNPIYLPDQITLHQIQYLSGRDGHTVMSFPAAGSFAYPVRVGDMTGDGADEIAVLAGDPNDLWLTYRDGSDGHALWSHRALPLKTSSYAWAVPQIEFKTLVTGPGPADRGFLMNLHMDVQAVVGEYSIYYIEVGGNSGATRGLTIDDHVIPQLTAVLDGAHGSATDTWAYPSAGDITESRQDGAAPGTVGVLALRARAEPSTAYVATQVLHETAPPAAGFAAGLLATLVPIALALRRKGGFP